MSFLTFNKDEVLTDKLVIQYQRERGESYNFVALIYFACKAKQIDMYDLYIDEDNIEEEINNLCENLEFTFFGVPGEWGYLTGAKIVNDLGLHQ
jgi:hypothetical protein